MGVQYRKTRLRGTIQWLLSRVVSLPAVSRLEQNINRAKTPAICHRRLRNRVTVWREQVPTSAVDFAEFDLHVRRIQPAPRHT